MVLVSTAVPFTILAVRTGEEPESELYPDPSDLLDTVEAEDGDGDEPELHEAIGLAVLSLAGSRPTKLAQLKDISATCVVTDSRVTVACSKYDKGGGWHSFGLGGLAIAATANAVSKARAKRRRRGRMLVGHVRYDWLGQIEAKDRRGFGGKNTLGLFMGDPTSPEAELVVLSVTLGKRETATEVAGEIARRAARYQASELADEASFATVAAYAEQPIYQVLDDGSHRFRLPAYRA